MGEGPLTWGQGDKQKKMPEHLDVKSSYNFLCLIEAD